MTDLTPSSIAQTQREGPEEPLRAREALPEALTLQRILEGSEKAPVALPSLHAHNEAKFKGVGPEGMGAVGLTMMFGGVIIICIGATGIFGQLIGAAFLFGGVILFAAGIFVFVMRDSA